MFRTFLYHVPQNFVASFRGYNLLFHLLAAVLTYVLVVSGIDWTFFEATRSPSLRFLIMGAGIGGFFIPVIVPVALYLLGEVKGRGDLMHKAGALAEAGVIAWLISSAYKAFTGRIQPEFLTNISSLDITREFHFGFLQNGIFWGWPSSHTAVAVAMSVALVLLFPRNSAVRYGALLYALFIALGASIGFHWLSDVVAGAIIGTLVGVVVAKNFHDRVAATPSRF